ncbi:hypothetical protein Avbf_17427 [Armadillidium vulgare]|nr:hypothetical protein Avbf_17427 [Armadillidium vulgare]
MNTFRDAITRCRSFRNNRYFPENAPTPHICVPPSNLKDSQYTELLAEKRVILDKLPTYSEVYIGCQCNKNSGSPCKIGVSDCRGKAELQCKLEGVRTCSDISCLDEYCKRGEKFPVALVYRFDPKNPTRAKVWRANPNKERMFFCCYTPRP